MCSLLMTFVPSRNCVNIFYVYVCIIYTTSGYSTYMNTCTGSLVQYLWSCTQSQSIGLVQYWWGCTHSQSTGLFVFKVRGSCVECHLLLSLVCDNKTKTRMLVTIGIRFKQHFDTRYFAFCNLSPPRMFLFLDLLSEYRIQHGTIGPLHVPSRYLIRILYRGVLGFATDGSFGVWCRGLTACLLFVGPLFGNRLLNSSWAVCLT